MNKVCNPSRFLKDIDPEYLKKTIDTLPQNEVGSVSYKRFSVDEISPRYERSATKEAPLHIVSSADEGAVIHTKDELHPGVKIVHPKFGVGEIEEIDDQAEPKIIVAFENSGNKTLLLKFAKFKILK